MTAHVYLEILPKLDAGLTDICACCIGAAPGLPIVGQEIGLDVEAADLSTGGPDFAVYICAISVYRKYRFTAGSDIPPIR